MLPKTNKAGKTSLAIKLIEFIAFLLKSFPAKYQNKFFEITLKTIPISILKLIPCSYSAYIKNYKPKKGDIIIDCGAHIGNCTILFSRIVGKDGIVIAMEPFEDSFRIFKERTTNLKANILAVNKGVWFETKKAILKIFHDQTISCQIFDHINNDKNFYENYNGVVECITIDDLINEIKPKRLDMIKMDIEGAEIEALKGATYTIQKYSPRFVIASYHIKNKEKTFLGVERFLIERGYTVKTFFPPHLTTYGEKRT